MNEQSEPLWYKDAIIYELHVKAFFDADKDGIGDFQGLREKLDYLQDLGITAIWLLPFYPSPLRDDGYDIADYRNVNASYGHLRDVRAFIKESHRRGLQVITELVINHTSDQHQWFQRARQAPPGSKWRDYYVWSNTGTEWPETRIIFTDTEKSNWAWDPVAKAYYWHRFFTHQPDLNFDNPRVLREVMGVMRFWLNMGVDGLRLDAIPYLVQRDGTSNENLPETHEIIKKLRAAMDETHPHAFFLAEANQWPEDTLPYFGAGDECQMAFHFPLMPRIYMAIAQEDRYPITDIIRQTPDIPESCQWAVFLRNHDELTLEMVTDRERDYMWSFYAADKEARLNLGIRRRLAPLLGNDRRKIELLNSLLFTIMGTPIIYYGDEIGMGDNVFLGDRNGVRTPMQWSPDRNAGFSRADPQRLYLPVVMDPVYGYEAVNVEAQQHSPSSLLSWFKQLIAVRRGPARKIFGHGSFSLLNPGNRKILAYLREYEDEAVLCVANLSRSAQAVELDLSRYKGRIPITLMSRSPFPPVGNMPYMLTLPPYGFYSFLLAKEAEAPRWHDPIPEPLPDFVTLVLTVGWKTLLSGHAQNQLEREGLPLFIPNQPWCELKSDSIEASRMLVSAELPCADGDHLLALIQVELTQSHDQQTYFLPLSIAWEEAMTATASPLIPYTLAKVRSGPKPGILYDAMVDQQFPRMLIAHLRNATTVQASLGEIRFVPGAGLRKFPVEEDAEIQRLPMAQSNSSALIGERLILKVFRRLQPELQPDLEVDCFLSDVAGYANTPLLLGSIVYYPPDGAPTVLATLKERIRHQGDGWTYMVEYLQRAQEESTTDLDDEARYGVSLRLVETLGQRTAELHRALCLNTGNAAIDPEPITPEDLEYWKSTAQAQALSAFAAIEKALSQLDDGTRAMAETLLGRRSECFARLNRLVPRDLSIFLTRYHGDYHLGQVVLVESDFFILDFHDDPAKPLAERRRKSLPLRDVAGMLRSLDYAASVGIMGPPEERASGADSDQVSVWRDLASNAFLKGYLDYIDDSICHPLEAEMLSQLLELFTLEKALHEICYEAVHRPAWLAIPLRAVLAIQELGES